MTSHGTISLLLVDSSPPEVEALKRAYTASLVSNIEVTQVALLSLALEELSKKRFDLVLLDLNLPDSQGVETFARLHAAEPSLPVLVLTSSSEDAAGEQAVQSGALDYLTKEEARTPWLGRSIRYAVERSRLQRELFEARQRERRDQELAGVERLSHGPGTAVTSGLYSSGTLREASPNAFAQAAAQYKRVLERAIEQRTHKGDAGCSAANQELGDMLGFLRAGPRDVIEVAIAALRDCIAGSRTELANAYVEEGRLTLLQLMGNLVGFYRTYYTPTQRKGAHRE